MKFRPCIDIHNGKVKQIVGGSLLDEGNFARENFVSEQDAGFFAKLYKEHGLYGGHAIILNKADSEYYEADLSQAKKAFEEFPGGLMIGGGVNSENAKHFIELGASHVIVTSYVFVDGKIRYDRIDELIREVGSKRLVLDPSCRKKDGEYYVVTDRWQKFTEEKVSIDLLRKLSDLCDEFLIHAVDVEGKASGIERELVSILGEFYDRPVTYAGGISSYEDIEDIRQLGRDHVDITIGSALDIFGGELDLLEVLRICKNGG